MRAHHDACYVGTFSKTLLPALHIAYLVLPPDLVEIFRSAKFLSDWAAPIFEQHALAGFLESGNFERHLRRARTLYAKSRAALVEAIDRELSDFAPSYCDSRAGLHLLLRFGALEGGDLTSLISAGRVGGVGLYPSRPCSLEGAPRELELVMGFSRLAPNAIRDGVGKLRSLLSDHRMRR